MAYGMGVATPVVHLENESQAANKRVWRRSGLETGTIVMETQTAKSTSRSLPGLDLKDPIIPGIFLAVSVLVRNINTMT